MTVDAKTAMHFVESTELPGLPEGLEGIEITAPDLPEFDKPDLAVTVGSQVASFADDVKPELRQQISNAFLFAQQAADKRLERLGEASSKSWYDTYVDVMSQIGWIREDASVVVREVTGTSLHVHKEIIPIVAAALGPAAATATVVNVLKGLQNMNQDSPWITLFQSASQRASANQFQISHTTQEEGTPRIRLVNFELDAERSVTQVLFFRLDTNKAELRHFENKMAVNEPIFGQVAPVIANRLADRIAGNILAIEI